MKQRTMTSVLLLLCALCMRAATIDVKTNLWSGTQTVTDGWQGSVQVRWTGMWFWRAADCISLLGIAATVVLYRKSQKNAAHV